MSRLWSRLLGRLAVGGEVMLCYGGDDDDHSDDYREDDDNVRWHQYMRKGTGLEHLWIKRIYGYCLVERKTC